MDEFFEHEMSEICDHVFCTSCIEDFVAFKVYSGDCIEIPCIEDSCTKKLSEDDIK